MKRSMTIGLAIAGLVGCKTPNQEEARLTGQVFESCRTRPDYPGLANLEGVLFSEKRKGWPSGLAFHDPVSGLLYVLADYAKITEIRVLDKTKRNEKDYFKGARMIMPESKEYSTLVSALRY